MPFTVNILHTDRIERYFTSVPEAAQKQLRQSVKKALKKAHQEALIQISRRYTIGMSATERDLREFIYTGGSVSAALVGRGRSRGALNFAITPKSVSPDGKAWTSKGGYMGEILSGAKGRLSSDWAWIRLRGGNVHLARRSEANMNKRDKASIKGLKVFWSVSTPQMLLHKDVLPKVTEATRAALEEAFLKGIKRRLLGTAS